MAFIHPTDTHGRARNRSIRILLAGTLLVLGGLTGAQSPGVTLEQSVHAWIVYRCDTGDEAGAGVSLEGLGPVAEAVLLKAAERGPPPDSMALLEDGLRESWNARVRLLESGETGLGPELIELLRAESKEDYMDRSRDEFSLGYREKAIVGLADVGSDDSRPLLERLIREADDILTAAAQEALHEIALRLEKEN